MARAPTFEHVLVPGGDRDETVALERRLLAVGHAAALYAAALLDVEVNVSWSFGVAGPVTFVRTTGGGLTVHAWVDLLEGLPVAAVAGLGAEAGMGSSCDRRGPTPDEWVAAFRTGFLHVLGRMLHSPNPLNTGEDDPPHPVAAAAGAPSPEWRRLPRAYREWVRGVEGARAATGLYEWLEPWRTDGVLGRRWAGAPRRLAPRTARLRAAVATAGMGAEGAAVRGWALALAGAGTAGAAAGAAEGATRGGGRLWGARDVWPDGPLGAALLGEAVVFELLPGLWAQADGVPPGLPAPPQGGRPVREAGAPASRGLPPLLESAGFRPGAAELDPTMATGAPGTVVVALPHVDGGEALVRIDHARAADLPPGEICRRVTAAVTQEYGAAAEEAFADQAGSLRRVLRVNWERRRRGRYRSGRHVGLANLRRYLSVGDTRVFQKMEAPEALSYHFHLLVDVSYSMLESRNMEKALALAYGFADVLTALRIPVDVTLYSGGVTDLFDHGRDALERYFGGTFGFLVSGTMEMEAIAYAAAALRRSAARRKFMVVLTDGAPVERSLTAVGASDLTAYYRGTLIPRLAADDIELLAVGIGCDPGYHARSVCLAESWAAVDVLVELLDEMIGVGERRTRALWT